MIREDRELLAEFASLNTAMAPLAIRIMDNSASSAEQQDYAQRLIAAGERLRKRTDEMTNVIIDGEVLENGPLALSEPGIPVTEPPFPISSIQAEPQETLISRLQDGR